MALVSRPHSKPLSLYWLAVPVLMLATVVAIALLLDSPAHQRTVSNAITIDLVLTIPLVYWLIVRRTSIPNTTAVPVFVLGIVVGGAIIAPADKVLLTQIQMWVLPALEILVVAFIVNKVFVARRRFRMDKDQDRDTFSLLKAAASEIFPPRLSHILATELAVFYYLLFSWKTQSPSDREFTSHRKSGLTATLVVMVLIIAVEATAMHILLAQWSTIAAWIITGLSVYTALQVAGMGRSLSRRFTTVGKREVLLRSGILSEASIPIEQIVSFGPSRNTNEAIAGRVNLSLLSSLEKPNFTIHVHESLEKVGLYGMQQSFSSIAFYVDEPARLNEVLEMVVT